MVNKTIGITTAQTDEAILIADPIAVGSLNTVKILDKEVLAQGIQSSRMSILISIKKKGVYIKFEPASKNPTTKKGIFVPKDFTMTIGLDSMFTGEISAISDNGIADIYVTVL